MSVFATSSSATVIKYKTVLCVVLQNPRFSSSNDRKALSADKQFNSQNSQMFI